MAAKLRTSLLPFLLLLAFQEMIILRGEAALCETHSTLFGGACFSDRNCATICEKEGFLNGRCKLLKCICSEDCGIGGGSGGAPPVFGPPQGGDVPPGFGPPQGGDVPPGFGPPQGGNNAPPVQGGPTEGGDVPPAKVPPGGGNAPPTQGPQEGGHAPPTQGPPEGGHAPPAQGPPEGGDSPPGGCGHH